MPRVSGGGGFKSLTPRVRSSPKVVVVSLLESGFIASMIVGCYQDGFKPLTRQAPPLRGSVEDEETLQSVLGGCPTLPQYSKFSPRSRVQGAHTSPRTEADVPARGGGGGGGFLFLFLKMLQVTRADALVHARALCAA